MKQETIKRVITMIEKDEPGTDVLLVTNNKISGVCSILCGDTTSIAHAMFVTMFDSSNPEHANNIYNIIRNIVVNMLNNPSPMGNDIVSVIESKIKEYGK